VVISDLYFGTAGITEYTCIRHYKLAPLFHDRSFFLSVDDLTSSSFPLKAGVPQGCVLSPFLFLIYINDLTERQDSLSLTFTFADDVALLPKLDAINRPLPDLLKSLQRSLDTFTSWAAFWRISFSPTKSNVVIFSRRRTPPAPLVPLKLASFTLACVDSYKYLGITLDNQFTFNLHSNNIVSSVRTQCSLLNRTISFSASPQPLTIRSLLLGKAYSILSYGLPFWEPSTKTLNKLVSLLSTPLRLSLGLPVYAPRMAILLEFRLLPPSILRQRLIHSFFHSLALSSDSPFKSLYEDQLLHPPAKSLPRYAHHLTSSLLKIDELIALPHTDHFNSSYDAFVGYFYEQWKAGKYPSKNDSTRSVGSKLVPFYSTFNPKVPPYLKWDEKPSLCHRARFRFDLCRNNASLHGRKLSNSAACDFCTGFTDCRRHILLDCPQHALYRRDLSCSVYPTAISLKMLLNPSSKATAQITSVFIDKIVKARDI
jgi:hypothetical protein